MPIYGKVITEEGYKNGNISHRIRKTEESIPVANRQELINHIFDQLKHLNECESVEFIVFADKHTHEPIRIVVTTEEKL